MYSNFETLGYVYILASRTVGTLYVGVTSDLVKRISEHKNEIHSGFTKRHKVHRLVYYEEHGSIVAAIEREKKLKKWKREWKIKLIEEMNPKWDDLFDSLMAQPLGVFPDIQPISRPK